MTKKLLRKVLGRDVFGNLLRVGNYLTLPKPIQRLAEEIQRSHALAESIQAESIRRRHALAELIQRSHVLAEAEASQKGQ